MSKPKVAVLINDMRAGGAERVVSILLNSLSSSVDFHLVLLGKTIEYDIPQQIKIHYLDGQKTRSSLKNIIMLPVWAKKYSAFCKENQIESSISFIYRSNYINSLSKSYGNKARIIVSERSYPSKTYAHNTPGNKLSKFLIRKLYNKADLVLTNSKLSAIDLTNNFNITTPIETIYNPIKLVNDKKKVERAGSFTFLNVANLIDYKNHEMLITAFAQLKNKNTSLLIAGKGPMQSTLEKLIVEFGLEGRVHLLGFCKNVQDLYSKSDCFILTSDLEGFPNVLLEAMANELPIISTDCTSGPRELLQPTSNIQKLLVDKNEIAEFGILIPVGKTSNLVQAMDVMLSESNLRLDYKAKGLEHVKSFADTTISQKYLKLLIA